MHFFIHLLALVHGVTESGTTEHTHIGHLDIFLSAPVPWGSTTEHTRIGPLDILFAQCLLKFLSIFCWIVCLFLITSSVQFILVSQLCLTLQPHVLKHARLPCPSPTPRLYSNTSIELVMPSNHLIRCCPLLLLPSIFPSIRVFSNESVVHIRWPKFWCFSFSISPSNEYSGLISFRMDWLDLLAVQGTLKSLLQHHSSKASILRCSALFVFLKIYGFYCKC